MDELNENNALLNQMRELISRFELQLRREEMARNLSAREPSFQHGFYPPLQQFGNPYPQDQYQFSAQDQFHFQNSDLVLDSYNSAYGDDGPYFQQQEASSYPQPYAHMQCSDFQQEEHGYYPQNQFLEGQQWSCYDPTLSPLPAATFDAIMEALKPSTAAGLSKEEGNKEEEENSLLVVNSRHSGQEAEKLEISTRAELKFRIGEELNQEETELIYSLLSAHYQDEIQQQKEEEEEGKMMEDDYNSYPLFRKGEEVFAYSPCEGGLYLQSVDDQHDDGEELKEKETELKNEEKELNSGHDSSLRMKSTEATIRYDFTWADFDSLFQGKHYVLQHGESENQEKEEEKEEEPFPHSPLLRSLVERDVEDFTCEDSDHLLHEESHTMAAHFQLQDEKQEEDTAAPILQQEKEAAEPHHPQSTTPMHQEEEAAHSFKSENLPFDFELTSNQFFLVVNELVSGGELYKKQQNLKNFYKLQSEFLCGEVHKRGTNGDGVLWNIKVHPP